MEPKTNFALLLCGRPKSGKTNVAFSFPNILYYDLDKNLESAIRRQRSKKDYLRVFPDIHPNGQELSPGSVWPALLNHLKENALKPEYKTIVLDSASKLREYLTAWLVEQPSAVKDLIIGGQKMMTQNHWGPYAVLMQRFLTDLRRLNKYIIVIAHVHDDKDESSGRWLTKPVFGGQTEDTAPGIFTDVWLCETQPTASGTDYYITTQPTAQMVLGNTLDLPRRWQFNYEDFKKRLEASNI